MSSSFFKILKATRIKRATYVPLSIITASVISGTFHYHLLILGFVGIITYPFGGLINSMKDNDYSIKSFYYYISLSLIFLFCLILSLINLKIFYLFSLAIFISFIYSTICRKIIFADMFALGITHILIPFLGTLFILNELTLFNVHYAIIPFLSFSFIVNVKNMVGFKKDIKRNYWTLMTHYSNGYKLMILSSLIGYILIPLFVLLLNLKFNLYIFSTISFLMIYLIILIIHQKAKDSLILSRFIIFLIFLGYLLEFSMSWFIILIYFFSGVFFVVDFIKLLSFNFYSSFKYYSCM